MSQFDFGDLSSPLSGTNFFDSNLEPWRDALHTSHSGSSRPSYVVNGTFWLDTTTTPYNYNMFDGTDDILIGTINATTNVFEPANKGHWGGSAGGTANALTLTPSPALAAYVAGNTYDFLVTATNTTESPTINVSGLGALNTKYNGGAGKVNLPIGAFQNGTIARAVYDGTDMVVMGVRPYNPSVNIASASTLNLDNATGDYVQVTGTTTVTAITLANGVERTARAAAAFTLTNGASLILPGAANITTEAGDVFVVRGEASGVVRIVNYQRADGTSIASGGKSRDLLETFVASNDTSVDFDSGNIDATYKEYELEAITVVPATDTAHCLVRTSSDGGTTWDSGASDYAWSSARVWDTSSTTTLFDVADSSIDVSPSTGWGNAAGESFNFLLNLFDPSNASYNTIIRAQANGSVSNSPIGTMVGGGVRLSAADVDALRIIMSTGNISGTFKLYGVN